MIKTVIFKTTFGSPDTDKIANGGQVEYTVKEDFVSKFKDINDMQSNSDFDLFVKHSMAEYLHNEEGPAIVVVFKPEHKAWFIHGKELTEEEFKTWKKNEVKEG